MIKLLRRSALLLCLVGVPACALFGGKTPPPAPPAPAPSPSPSPVPTPTPAPEGPLAVKKAPEDVLISVRELDPKDTQVFSDGSGHVECEWRAAGRFLGELRAVPFLAEKIGAGDEHAIVLAGLSGLDRLVPFLAKQRARESGKKRKRIEEALDRLKRN